ncbi:DNA polymerase IV [Streptococcus ruminantium]|uniref:DNA polymerase IV n=1 Tax=Streptococcus ruminantium TaxID=1917441 RepID=A0ABU1B7A9_9STRE|nr:DNA polymerase IV [Streptococcus ruminantium]MDQ8759379.1 DNA polymerase IV [Streptococcus ruminantium]MDQ8764966.1 DNA polymerase IV [Streptococcus ruminantium]MDQ8767477.1 DNA polymerase IV [Streptococcus ruminantium]MDQ8769761.1 DNA polymerase IV [Streptococcus ruminantium]MDQ8774492.1 DNA polymerase IV [Streptococcus ruminantium]
MLIFPLINDLSRKIIHVDMDAFFAAIEVRDHPDLKGKPVVIGADPRLSGGRGVVSTCNYEARAFGIHSAMSSKEAYERCPQAIFISGNYEKYQEVGGRVRDIFYRYTDLVEPMSIDEAYLDVTDNKLGIRSAVKIAKLIQYDIWNELHLTASAGVSYNKFLAKIASDMKKPHGLTLILPEEAVSVLAALPVEKFHGVGKKTVERLHAMEVYTGADLLKLPEMELIDRFGRFGYDLYRRARGISNAPVRVNRVRKSIGKEKTYRKLLYREEDAQKELASLCQRVVASLVRNGKKGKTIVLKIRYGDFSTLTKRHSLEDATDQMEVIEHQIRQLFEEVGQAERGIRLLGVTVTNFQA